MEKTIISVSGYGATGSSAVVDYLKGFEELDVLDDFEFQLHYFPDGISDLDYHLNESCNRHYDSDVAICRFLELCRKLDHWYEPAFHGQLYKMAQDYINSLRPITWNGCWAIDRLNTPQNYIDRCNAENERIVKRNSQRRFANRFLRRIHLPQFQQIPIKSYGDFFRNRTMYMSLKPDNFLKETQAFSNRMITMASHKDVPVKVVNMLLPPQNPVRYFKYFDCPVKAIVTTRDPRDLYIHVKRPNWRVVPFDDVWTFVAWYKEMMKQSVNVDDDSVLRIAFEDMIYEYEDTTAQIRNFIGLANKTDLTSSFDPHVSVANTQHYKRFSEFRNDISIIERELTSYLYDFASHKEVVATTDVVF